MIRALFQECRERLVDRPAAGLDLIEARKLEMLCYVRQRGAVPVAEFHRRFGLRRAIQSPLFQLLRRETRDDQGWLVFDKERLREYAARGFDGFLDWDRALLRALTEVAPC